MCRAGALQAVMVGGALCAGGAVGAQPRIVPIDDPFREDLLLITPQDDWLPYHEAGGRPLGPGGIPQHARPVRPATPVRPPADATAPVGTDVAPTFGPYDARPPAWLSPYAGSTGTGLSPYASPPRVPAAPAAPATEELPPRFGTPADGRDPSTSVVPPHGESRALAPTMEPEAGPPAPAAPEQ